MRSAARFAGDVAQAITYNANSPSAGADFQPIGKTSRGKAKDPYHKDVLKLVRFCQQVKQKPDQERRDRVDGHALDYRPDTLKFGGGSRCTTYGAITNVGWQVLQRRFSSMAWMWKSGRCQSSEASTSCLLTSRPGLNLNGSSREWGRAQCGLIPQTFIDM